MAVSVGFIMAVAAVVSSVVVASEAGNEGPSKR